MEISTASLFTGASWLWEKYGDQAIDHCTEKLKDKWKELKWPEAERRYREKVFSQVSTTLLLGYPKPIRIDSIYTDVYVLDQISAKRRFDFEDLTKKPIDFDGSNLKPERIKAEVLLEKSKRIFILGKPGAGKTTFLKYLALLACTGTLEKTPIYLSLKEWSDSGLNLQAFIEKQFNICGFPDPSTFVKSILQAGQGLVLLDGLDEVNQEGEARAKMVQALVDLANQFSECTFCLTCRVAATDYTFTQFTYVEIADFNESQKQSFIRKWYQHEPEKLNSFLKEWRKPENYGFRDLAQTPLLLALLCLAYDETLHFAKRRVDLYTEALDALLKKWDSSRGVFRAEVYRKISLTRKKQLLSRIAAKNFEKGNYLIRKQVLVTEIQDFLLQLPPDDKETEPEAEDVLSAIEYQHGLLVERAHCIYSFSHLTFQEYFTARYIIENQGKGTLNKLIDDALKDPRWREVLLMCSSLLDDATVFLGMFSEKLWSWVSSHAPIVDLIEAAESPKYKSAFSISRSSQRTTARTLSPVAKGNPEAVIDACLGFAAEFSFGTHDSHSPSYSRAHIIISLLSKPDLSEQKEIVDAFLEKKAHTSKFVQYMKASQLLIECLRISWVEDRHRIADSVLKSRR